MTCQLVAGNDVIYELEYYSVGGGFIEWNGYTPRRRDSRNIPMRRWGDCGSTPRRTSISIADVILANEIAVGGKSEDQINAFLDKIPRAMLATVKSGLSAKDDVLPGPIKLHSKAATVWARAMDEKYVSDRAIGLGRSLRARGIGGKREGPSRDNGATGGSAGVMPAIVFGLVEGKRNISVEQIRRGLLAGAAVGYLCKHNATLSGAEGGCQAEIGVASAMSAAMVAEAMGSSPQTVENAAESALESHLGLTCDPVAGYVQVPCIERCAFGAVKAWTAFMIASNEDETKHRVDLDTTIKTMAETGRDMSSKYKETSEGGLAANLVLC